MQQSPALATTTVSSQNDVLGVATSSSEIAALAIEWESIVQQSDELDLFVSPSWMTLWYETVMSGQAQPAVVWVNAPDGRLAGVLPLVRHRRRYLGPVPCTLYESAGDAVICGDHLGLVVSQRDFAYVYSLVRDWLLSRAADGALVRLVALDEGGRFATSLQRDLEEHTTRWRHVMQQVAPRLSLPDSYEAYERLLSSKRRKLIRRNWRSLERDHGATVCCNDEAAPLESVLEEWFALHDKLWASRGRCTALESNQLREFLRRFCQEAARRGWLRLHQIRVNQRLVAGTIVFHWKDRAYYYQSGWAQEFADYGIGELVVTQSIRVAIDERLSVFDFLRGAERYKFWLRAQPHALVGLEFACGGPAWWLVWAGGIRERVGRIVRRVKGAGNAEAHGENA